LKLLKTSQLSFRSLAVFLSAACLLSLGFPAGTPPANAAARQVRTLPGEVPDVVTRGKAVLIDHNDPRAVLHLTVTLQLRQRNALQRFLRELNDPTSPSYHHFLTQHEANRHFNPTVSQERTVRHWLQLGGLTVTRAYANHLMLDARGTSGQIEHLLRVKIDDFHATVHGKEHDFFAPAMNPTIGGAVSSIVQTIGGLDSYPRNRFFSNGRPHGVAPYYPQDFAQAYRVTPLWNKSYTGSGQHIGLTLWTLPPSDTTLRRFKSVTGAAVATVGNGKLKVTPVDGGTTTKDVGEAAMDIEYSSGLAPGATIDYYEAPTDGNGNPTDRGLEDALNLAGTDRNHNQQISSSWGGCESVSANESFTTTTSSIFQSNEATGHAYLFSSGDSGSWCDAAIGRGGQDPYPAYPASSPYVTSVGGTRFDGTVTGSWPGESAWTYCAICSSGNPVGSGGGYSSIFARPVWQHGSGLEGNGKRGYPDISADADPQTGAYVCYGAQPRCGRVGGTSLASPIWAGMTAVLNNYLAKQRGTTGFLAPTLYHLAATTQPYPAMHDITSGNNGVYSTGPNWDAVTGWGSTNLFNLARDLALLQPAARAPTTR
jgi:kumamolisin